MRIFDNKYQYLKDLGGGGFGIVDLVIEGNHKKLFQSNLTYPRNKTQPA
jgi:hypothetical protein